MLHQFIVDAYTCIEYNCFNWLQCNKRKLQSDIYHGLQDAITQGDHHALSHGHQVILPFTFTGGPQYMVQHKVQQYQDATIICRSTRTPDLFVTFT